MVAGLYATMSYGLALIYGVMKIINLANAGIMVLLELFLRGTFLGRAIRALAQDREACALVGVDTKRVSMVAFGLGSALAGAAGCLLTLVFPFDPTNPFGVLQLKSFTIIVL